MKETNSQAVQKMRIRSFVLEDAAEIARLSGQLGYPVSVEDVHGNLQGINRDSNHSLFVALDDTAGIIGWIHMFRTLRAFTGPFAEIGGLVVDENERGFGVGQALLRQAESWAQSMKCSLMLIRSNVIRERARGFYHEIGYEILKQQNVFKKSL